MNGIRLAHCFVVPLLFLICALPLAPEQPSQPFRIMSLNEALPTAVENELRDRVTAIVRAIDTGNPRELQTQLNGFVIPDDEAWFRRTFGETYGPAMASHYFRTVGKLQRNTAEQFAHLRLLAGDDLSKIDVRVERYPGALSEDDLIENANDFMQTPTDLYLVRFLSADDRLAVHAGHPMGGVPAYLTYVDGHLRFAGDRAIFCWLPGTEVRRALIVDSEPSTNWNESFGRHIPYPKEALERGLKGTVVLQGNLDNAGRVQTLRLVEGHPLLAANAMTTLKELQFKMSDQPDMTKVQVEFTVIFHTQMWESSYCSSFEKP